MFHVKIISVVPLFVWDTSSSFVQLQVMYIKSLVNANLFYANFTNMQFQIEQKVNRKKSGFRASLFKGIWIKSLSVNFFDLPYFRE